MKQRINIIFNVQPGEEKLVFLMLIHSFAIGVAISFFYTAASALFLADYDVSQLPIIYILGAVAVVIVSSVFSRVAAKYSTYHVLLFTLVALIFFVTAVYLGLLLSPAPWVLFGVIVWFRIFETPLLLEFSSLASRMFDARQGKRLFGLLGTGESIARILGGLFIGSLVIKIGTVNLLLIAICGLILCLVMYWLIARTAPQNLQDKDTKEQSVKQSAKVAIFRNRYLLPILLLYIFAAAAKHFVDFLFFAETQQQFASRDELAAFLGYFFSVVQFTLLFTGSFLSGRLISRFGLNFGLWIQPIVFGIMIALIIITSSFSPLLGLVFWFVALAKLSEVVFYKAFKDPSLWVLFAPIEASKRLAAQVAIGGRGRPLGAGFAGIVLIIFTTFFADSPNGLNIFIFFFAVSWILVAVWTYREYIIMLGQALSRRLLDRDAPLSLDSNSLTIVEKNLTKTDPETTIYALDILAEHTPEKIVPYLPALLQHENATVRIAALQHIQNQQVTTLLPQVRLLLSTRQSEEVSIAALHTIAALSDQKETTTFTKYLNAGTNLRHAALVSLLTDNSDTDHALAVDELNIMLWGSSNKKQDALRVIGETNISDFDVRLPQFLQDADTAVQQATIITMGQRNQPEYWPLIIESLFNPSLHEAAITAIAAGGEDIVPFLQEQLNDRNRKRNQLRHLIKACRYIPPAAVFALLEPLFDHPHHRIRTQVYTALYRARYHADTTHHAQIQLQIQVELKWATQLLTTIVDVAAHDSTSLLVSALHEQIDVTKTRIIYLIGFLYEIKVVQDLNRSFTIGSTENRALALEWLDEQLADDLSLPIITLLRPLPVDEQATQLEAFYAQAHMSFSKCLENLIAHNWTPWITICAAYTALKGGLINNQMIVEAMRSYEETSIHDTYVIMTKIVGEQKREEMLQLIEKVLILKSVELFTAIPDSILAKVASLTQEIHIEADEDIIKEGETGDSMYIIVDGEVQIHDGEHVIASLGNKEIFGEMALLDAKPRMATVTATKATQLLQLDHEPFFELMTDYPVIAKGIIKVLSRRLRAFAHH